MEETRIDGTERERSEEIRQARIREMEKLKEITLQCCKCPLRKGANGVVFGEGNPNAALVLCGEGPGSEEDKQLRPFVGAAGQLLDKILHVSGFNRFEHTYILNVVKCRPPGNRTPLPQEREACFPHLQAQLAIIRPKIVILLGATALQTLIDPKGKISRYRGHWIQKEGIWFMPTYHPAALLRNPALKRETWHDFKLVISKYRELVDPFHDTPYFPLNQ
ncbi:uracil-DNA glycosylase [Bacillaceae bacterium]